MGFYTSFAYGGFEANNFDPRALTTRCQDNWTSDILFGVPTEMETHILTFGVFFFPGDYILAWIIDRRPSEGRCLFLCVGFRITCPW